MLLRLSWTSVATLERWLIWAGRNSRGPMTTSRAADLAGPGAVLTFSHCKMFRMDLAGISLR